MFLSREAIKKIYIGTIKNKVDITTCVNYFSVYNGRIKDINILSYTRKRHYE